jgi:hypothetical protein
MNEDTFELRIWRVNGNKQAATFRSFPEVLRAAADALEDSRTLQCAVVDLLEQHEILHIEIERGAPC